MLPAANALAFALAAFALIIIPGPSVLFVIGRSLSLGRRGGMLSLLGNAFGMLPAIALVSLGVGAVVAESAIVFAVIKYLGAAYVIYLGVQAIRHRTPRTVARPTDEGEITRQAIQREEVAAAPAGSLAPRDAPHSAFRLLREGFIVGATNPKTLVFFVAILPQFVSQTSPLVPLQMAALGLIFFAIALLSDSVWALTASTARQWFARDPKRMSRVSATGGVMMIGLGGALALSGNKH